MVVNRASQKTIIRPTEKQFLTKHIVKKYFKLHFQCQNLVDPMERIHMQLIP